MNLAQLYYFRTLAKFEHYGKAAEALYITQPSLSNSIKNLEKEIGVPFFERVGATFASLNMVKNSTSTSAALWMKLIKRSKL